jgi:hypothetical protein
MMRDERRAALLNDRTASFHDTYHSFLYVDRQLISHKPAMKRFTETERLSVRSEVDQL